MSSFADIDILAQVLTLVYKRGKWSLELLYNSPPTKGVGRIQKLSPASKPWFLCFTKSILIPKKTLNVYKRACKGIL